MSIEQKLAPQLSDLPEDVRAEIQRLTERELSFMHREQAQQVIKLRQENNNVNR